MKLPSLRPRLSIGDAILLLGVAITQVYTYFRYGFFPSDPRFSITSLPSSSSLERTLKGHSSQVFSLTFSPDGKTLASGSADNTIKLWNLSTGQQLRTLKGH